MCEHANKIQAYHDDALGAAEGAAIAAHVESCDECRLALNELRGVSKLIASAALPTIPADLPARIFNMCQTARRAQDAGTRKLAAWLTAAAAIVLIAAMIRTSGLSSGPSENTTVAEATNGASRDWEFAAIMPPDRQTEDAGSAELIQFAQWMASDLSPDDRR